MTQDSGRKQGRLVVFEGPDGMGKTTVAKAVAKALQSDGHEFVYWSFPGAGTGTLGDLVYRLHHDYLSVGVKRAIPPTSQQVIHLAAHLDAIESEILPRLKEGGSVVLDRFWWSTWVYGIAAGVDEGILSKMIDIEQACWAPTLPDLLFVVHRNDVNGDAADQLWSLYRTVAKRESSRYPVLPLINDRSIRAAVDEVRAQITPLLGGLV